VASADVDARQLVSRLDAAFDALDRLDPIAAPAAAATAEAVDALVALYAEALERIVEHVTHAPRDELLTSLTQDDLVGHVLVAHELLPAPPGPLDLPAPSSVETPVVLRSRKQWQGVPDRRRALPPLERGGLSTWAAIGVPVQIAFVVMDDDGVPTVRYPGPTGVTHADLGDLAWRDLLLETPELAKLEPEVEALLIRDRSDECTRHIVPIDDCFRLIALMQTSWVGITGGPDMWATVDRWFAELDALTRMLDGNGRHGARFSPEFEEGRTGGEAACG